MLPKILTSSVDSSKLALTVKGLLVGIIPLFILFAQFKGVSISEIEITGVIDAVGSVIMAVTGLSATIMTFIGLIRKIMVKFKK